MERYISSSAAQEYLEQIHMIESTGKPVRPSELAEAVGVSQASVTSMVRKLSQEGFVHYTKYQGFTLTSRGVHAALVIRRRQEILTKMFLLLGVDSESAQRDASRIRAHMGLTTFRAVEAFVEASQNQPSIKSGEI